MQVQQGVSDSVTITGGATAANQTNGLQLTQIVDAGGEAVTVTGGKLDVNASFAPSGTQDVNLTKVGGSAIALGQALAAASLPVVLTAAQISTLTPLSTVAVTQSTSPWVVSLTSTTVTGTVAVTQSGTWNLNNISGTISLPTGAATLTEQQTQTTSLQLLDNAISGAGFNITQFAGVNNVTGSGTATGALRVELPTNGTGVVGLGTGTNSIGDVRSITTSIVPGTAATNLGKAEDTAHTTGDTGVFDLAVSNENLTAFGAASGDYTPYAVNRYGQLYVTARPPTRLSSNGTPIAATLTTAIAAPSAGNHLRVLRFHFSNAGATATVIGIRDGAAGTIYYETYLVQGAVVTLDLNTSGVLDLTTATRLDITMNGAGSVYYTVDYNTVAD